MNEIHKNTGKGNTFSLLTTKNWQETTSSLHLKKLKTEVGTKNSNNQPLPKLCKNKVRQETNNNSVSWDCNSATSVSWVEGVTVISTERLLKEWESVERTLYDEDNQALHESILNECMQWKTQIVYLRIVGVNIWNTSFLISDNVSMEQQKKESGVMEYNYQREKSDISSKFLSKNKIHDKVFDIITDYIYSKLFRSEDDKVDSLSDHFSDRLKIEPVIIYRDENALYDYNINVDKKQVLNTCLNKSLLEIRHKNLHSSTSDRVIKTKPVKNNHRKSYTPNEQKLSRNKQNALQIQYSNECINSNNERLYTPQIKRNKLGTVFNQRIVVSPVPYTVSTKESFCTLKTIPIRYMEPCIGTYSTSGSAKHITPHFEPGMRKMDILRISNVHPTLQTSTNSTVWPKNVKLAPINTSQLIANKTRSSVPSPSALSRGRKSLSPISMNTKPITTFKINTEQIKELEIEGHSITSMQIKGNPVLTAWEYDPKIVNISKPKRKPK